MSEVKRKALSEDREKNLVVLQKLLALKRADHLSCHVAAPEPDTFENKIVLLKETENPKIIK